MLGDGMVSFGVPVVTIERRKAKSGPKIGSSSPILPSTRSAAEVKSRSPWALRKCTRMASVVRLTPRSR